MILSWLPCDIGRSSVIISKSYIWDNWGSETLSDLPKVN